MPRTDIGANPDTLVLCLLYLWRNFSPVSGPSSSPERPRIEIESLGLNTMLPTDLPFGLHKDGLAKICCIAQIVQNVTAEIRLTINPNNDDTMRRTSHDFIKKESVLCYTIRVELAHHTSQVSCTAVYRFECPNCTPREVRTTATAKLQVYVLNYLRIEGPSTVHAGVNACWTCTLSKVSYDMFEEDFSLIWQADGMKGLSTAYFKKRTRLPSPTDGAAKVLKMHSVVSGVCLWSPRPGRPLLQCKVRLWIMPPQKYFRDIRFLNITPAPTTTTTTTLPTTLVSSVSTTTATSTSNLPSETATAATSTNIPNQSGTFQKRPVLSDSSDNQIIITLAVLSGIVLAIILIAIIYRCVRKYCSIYEESRKQETLAVDRPHSSSDSKHESSASEQATRIPIPPKDKEETGVDTKSDMDTESLMDTKFNLNTQFQVDTESNADTESHISTECHMSLDSMDSVASRPYTHQGTAGNAATEQSSSSVLLSKYVAAQQGQTFEC